MKYIKIFFFVCGIALIPYFLLPLKPVKKPGKYVWSLGFAYASDVKLKSFKHKKPHSYIRPEKVKEGDVIWLQAPHVALFAEKYLPQITHSFVLVITDGDEAFPSSFQNKMDVEAFIQNSKIRHIFAQNCDYQGVSSEKVSPLPIGIDLHTLADRKDMFQEKEKISSKKQEAMLEETLATLKPTEARKKRALVDFQFNDTIRSGGRYLILGEDRASIFQKILLSGVIDPLPKPLPRQELWKRKGDYAFSVAPQGNGMDTHRLWEDLILGCIVIVKTSPLDALYKDLPVVIVQDWSEITPHNLDMWLKMYGDAFTNPHYREKLTHRYWEAKIRAYTKHHL